MKKSKNNEELQSRRQFFKKAAKGILPIIGAIALGSVSVFTHASSHEGNVETGCSGYCSYGCSRGCDGECRGGCQYTCRGGCQGSCEGSCRGTCMGSCRGGCVGLSY